MESGPCETDGHNSITNSEVSPSIDVNESNCQTDPPPLEEAIGGEENSSAESTVNLPGPSSEPLNSDSDLDDLDQRVIIIEYNPWVRKNLKSCFKSKSSTSYTESSENENRSDNGTNSTSEPTFGNGQSDDGVKSVRFSLEPIIEGETDGIISPQLTSPLPEDEVPDEMKPLIITPKNHVVQDSSALNTNSRENYDKCVTQPNLSVPCSSKETVVQDSSVLNTYTRKKHIKCVTLPNLSVPCSSKETVGETVVQGNSVLTTNSRKKHDKCVTQPDLSVPCNSKETVEEKDKKTFHLKESALNIPSEAEKNKPTILEKLHMANTVPNSTLSSDITKELQIRRKENLSIKGKPMISDNRPRQNFVLHESRLTDTCASISASYAPTLSERKGLPNKGIKGSSKAMQGNDPMVTSIAEKSLMTDLNETNNSDLFSQISEMDISEVPCVKQKQVDGPSSQKCQIKSDMLKSSFSNKDISQFGKNIDETAKRNVRKLPPCPETQEVKQNPMFPVSPNVKQLVCKSKNSEEIASDLGGLSFLRGEKAPKTSAHTPLFNINESSVADREKNSYEDLPLAKNLKRNRKSSAPAKLMKGSPDEVNVKESEDMSCPKPETDDVLSRLTEKESMENAGLPLFKSNIAPNISQTSLDASPLAKKPRIRGGKTSLNNRINQQTELKVKSSSELNKERKSETTGSTSANLFQKSSPFEMSTCNSDSKLKEQESPSKTNSIGEGCTVKSNVSKNKYQPEVLDCFSAKFSEITRNFVKSQVTKKKKATLDSEECTRRKFDFLDLAGGEKMTREKLVSEVAVVFESFSSEPYLKKGLTVPIKVELDSSDEKCNSLGDNTNQSRVRVKPLEIGENSISQRTGRKKTQRLQSKNCKTVNSSPCKPSISSQNATSLPESRSKNRMSEESSNGPTDSVGEKISKLSLCVKESESQSDIVNDFSEVSYSPQGPLLTMKRKKIIGFNNDVVKKMKGHSSGAKTELLAAPKSLPSSPKLRKSSTSPKWKSRDLEKKKSMKTTIATIGDANSSLVPAASLVHPDQSVCVSAAGSLDSGVNLTSDLNESRSPTHLSPNIMKREQKMRLPLSSIPVPSSAKKCQGLQSEEILDRELLSHRYSIKNCCVKLNKLTSEDIKRYSCFASGAYRPKKSPKLSPSHRPSFKRSPCIPPRRNVCITPENIPKLQKVMEDVISSDDEGWPGWQSLITDLGDGTLLVSVKEGSEINHSVVSEDPPDYPTVKCCDHSDYPTVKCDQSTDTSDLNQL